MADRTTHFALMVAMWVGCSAFSRAEQTASLAGKRPNIILIVADDMGYGDTGVFGCTDIKTPNLDRLAAAGTVFTDAYVTGPICVPSRMGLLTGRYQQRWGIYGNNDGLHAARACGDGEGDDHRGSCSRRPDMPPR